MPTRAGAVPPARERAALDVRRDVGWVIAVLALAAGLVVLFGQVEVGDGSLGVTRTCGSPLDSAVDRSGWEQWWARDLDEPDAAVRAALLRTNECPDAVNRRIAIAAALGGLGLAAGWFARRPSTRPSPDGPGGHGLGRRLTRLGLVTSAVGAAFALAGLVAVFVLVADADSTLFLYTDRLVVAVVGLIVLVPTLALFAIGRVLTIVAPHLDRAAGEHTDDDEEEHADE